MKTVVFVASSPRSGSTWLSYVLASHSPCAYVGEYHRKWLLRKDRDWVGSIDCRLCQAKGMEECEYLSGLDDVEEKNAHDFAFSRFGKEFIIDNSKRVGWISKFVRPDLDYKIKVIHLIRDPRGYYCSQKRRNLPGILETWVEYNSQVKALIDHHDLDSHVVFYEDLAGEELSCFSRLCDFIGFDFDPKALKYWLYEHHGLGANGASSMFLKELEHGKDLYTTGDNEFYDKHNETSFVDTRWETELTDEELTLITSNRDIIEILSSYNRSFGPGKLIPA